MDQRESAGQDQSPIIGLVVPPPLAAAYVEAKPFPSLRAVKGGPATRPGIPVEVAAPAPGAITTPRLVLRPLVPGDRTAFMQLLAESDEHLRGRMNVHRGSKGVEADAAAFHRLVYATEWGESSGHEWRRAAFLANGGQPVGMVHVLGIRRGMEFRGDAGWWIGPRYCGNGLATEMVSAMVQHATRDLPAGLGLHVVSAAIAPDHEASRRVAERAGFRRVPNQYELVVIEDRREKHESWEVRVSVG